MRLGEAARRAREAFAAAGLDSPELDARVLAAEAAGLRPQDVLLRGDTVLDADACARLDGFVARRLAREPVARILGRREFWGLDIALSAETLVPRPDTETLVEAALDALDRGGGRDRPVRIADLGTGSGAILAALLVECPSAIGVGIDRSETAAVTARDNLRRAGVGARAVVLVGDWAQALAPGGFDLIVSNPPYIASEEIATLEPEVTRFDPLAALDGGADGLDCYRALLPGVRTALVVGGTVFLEIGETQAGDVELLLADTGFLPIGPARQDLAGHPRVVGGISP